MNYSEFLRQYVGKTGDLEMNKMPTFHVGGSVSPPRTITLESVGDDYAIFQHVEYTKAIPIGILCVQEKNH